MADEPIRSPAAPAAWPADFVQHLRAVHFALLLLAGGLLAAASDNDRVVARTALPIVQQIARFCAAWDSNWMDRFRPNRAAGPKHLRVYLYVPPERGSAYDRKYRGPGITEGLGRLKSRQLPGGGLALITEGLARLELDLAAPADSDNWAWELAPGFRQSLLATPSAIYLNRAPSTLAEFQDWWDKTSNFRLQFCPLSDLPTYSGKLHEHNPLAVRASDQWDSGDSVELHTYGPKERPAATHVETVALSAPYDSPSGIQYKAVVHLPTGEERQLTFDAGRPSDWIDADPRYFSDDWRYRRKGQFSAAFPELHGLQVGLTGLSFTTANEILEKQAVEVQTLDLGGVRFRVAQWGILLVLGLQLYVWILVRELGARSRSGVAPGLDVAWVGTFGSRLARVVFLGSLLLPAAAVAVLSRQLFTGIYQAGTILASLALSLLIFRAVPTRPNLSHAAGPPS